ncbi:YlzJ-like family protein [Bacillus sp. FJAT-50079]|uniref:YlzJ-like family protein n=1 Tax=Bacillus sp. FJAT-50079 TaxID=2833577 RepID=UPI001BC9FB41|nr:YlzJ-like family protein [Bacillus sp. FJAT-50079]MBS4207564.1 YlzJ-like family protein [Bacillus sp. FJAT-50079]
MILHTIVPLELIFPNESDRFAEQKAVMRNGIPMIVEQNGDMYKVVRIMSSNPTDFLRNDLSPGSYIPITEK